MRITKNLTWTAYHEAGHAVAAHENRVRIRKVSILPDDESLGRTNCKWSGGGQTALWRPRQERLLTERQVIVLTAGQIAEQESGSKRKWGSDHDLQLAVDCLARISGSDEEVFAYLAWLQERTTNLIRLHWAGVEALAAALLDRREIGGRTARGIILEALAIPAHEFKYVDLTQGKFTD